MLDHEKICADVLAIDSKIRFTGVANTKGVLTTHSYQKGVKEYLNESELNMSLHYSMLEWEKSKNLNHWLGTQTAFVAEYEKVSLISIPMNNNDLFVASLEPGEDYFQIIQKIKPLFKE